MYMYICTLYIHMISSEGQGLRGEVSSPGCALRWLWLPCGWGEEGEHGWSSWEDVMYLHLITFAYGEFVHIL